MTNTYLWLSSSERCWRTSELEEMGLSRRAVSELIRRKVLVRLQVNGYVAAKYWHSLNDADKARCKLLAHAHASRSQAASAYSHTSAARVHGLSLWNVDAKIHITQSASGSSREHSQDVARHKAPLLPSDLDMVDGLRVTSLARTVVDCARLLTYRQGLIVADHALRLGAQPTELQEILARQRGYKGVHIARSAIDHASPLSESPGETLTAHILCEMPIPQPQQQLVVQTRLGEHRIDFAWKEQKLALEFGGKTKYFDYVPTPDALFQERRREKALMEEGWVFIRLEWADLFKDSTRGRILRAWWDRTRSAA